MATTRLGVWHESIGSKKKVQKRPPIELQIWKTNGSYWQFFKEHYYLDLPHPPCAEYFVGTVNGELVCHVAVVPLFTANAYRATRLVVMPEWQGAGVGTQFLNFVMQYHLEGNGRCNRKLHTFSILHTLNYVTICAILTNGNKPPLNYMEIIKPEVRLRWRNLKSLLQIKD